MSLRPLHTHLVLFMMLSLAFTGCSTIQVQVKETPGSAMGIEAGECITAVLDFQGGSPQQAQKVEKSIGVCISNAMVEHNISVGFIYPDEFRRAVFPDMDITSAPRSPESILELLSSHQFRDKIKSFNLRYLITVRELTFSYSTMEAAQDALYWVHHLSTELVANIIDLQKAADSGEVRVTVADRGYYGCFALWPVVLPAFTESKACKTFGRTVTKFLLGEKKGELSK